MTADQLNEALGKVNFEPEIEWVETDISDIKNSEQRAK
jgi:hypothetical protein